MWSNSRENSALKNNVELTIMCKLITPALATTPGNPEVYTAYLGKNAPNAMKLAEELDAYGEENVERLNTTRFLRGPMFQDAKNPFKWYDKGNLVEPVPEDATMQTVNLMWDYQMSGFFKEKISFLQRASDKTKSTTTRNKSKSEKLEEEFINDAASDFAAATGKKKFACSDLKAYKKVVDGLIKPKDRKIPIIFPETFWDDERGEMPSLDPNGLPWVYQRSLRVETMQGPRTALASSEVAPAGSIWCCTINIMDPNLVPVVKECLDFGQFVGMLQNRGNGYGRFIWTPIDAKTGEIID